MVWGEVSASAVFEPELRGDVRRVTETWRAEVAAGITAGIADGSIDPGVEADDAADLLITLVDGLLARWLAGTIGLDRARELLSGELRARLLR